MNKIQKKAYNYKYNKIIVNKLTFKFRYKKLKMKILKKNNKIKFLQKISNQINKQIIKNYKIKKFKNKNCKKNQLQLRI